MDGVSALIVCFIIAVTAIGALFKWVTEMQAHIDSEASNLETAAYEHIPQIEDDFNLKTENNIQKIRI